MIEPTPRIGTPVGDLFQGDLTLELEITANRGDCLSHIGVAREISAHYEYPLKLPELHFDASTVGNPSEQNLITQLQVDSPNCPYYALWSIRGVKIGKSPEWLKTRLESVGARSVNNVVDITNFVLLETGQPLHAFDASKIEGQSVHVRQARESEKITTLDGVERTLDSDMMVIADQKKSLVIAGIMGSVDAEVDDSTVDILLEAAWFKPGNVRATARRLGLFLPGPAPLRHGPHTHLVDPLPGVVLSLKLRPPPHVRGSQLCFHLFPQLQAQAWEANQLNPLDFHQNQRIPLTNQHLPS